VSPALAGLVALLLGDPDHCLLRDPAVIAPPALFGPLREARATDTCPPDRVRKSEMPPRARQARAAPGPADRRFTCEHDGCWAWAGVGERGALIGAAATIEVWSPTVGSDEHSLAELALRGGPDLREVLEIGWTVSPRHRADGRPILLVQRWSGGRLQQGTGGLHPWSSAHAPGMDLSAWIGRTVRVGWLRWEDRWWAWFEGSWIGWYGAEEEGAAFQEASAAQWFGEVFFAGSRPGVPMGNGHHPAEGEAARFRDLCTISRGQERCMPPRSLWPQVSDAEAYGLSLDDREGFRYGGSGTVDRVVRPRPPPSSASEGRPPATGR